MRGARRGGRSTDAEAGSAPRRSEGCSSRRWRVDDSDLGKKDVFFTPPQVVGAETEYRLRHTHVDSGPRILGITGGRGLTPGLRRRQRRCCCTVWHVGWPVTPCDGTARPCSPRVRTVPLLALNDEQRWPSGARPSDMGRVLWGWGCQQQPDEPRAARGYTIQSSLRPKRRLYSLVAAPA
jgi:hypothetical protein